MVWRVGIKLPPEQVCYRWGVLWVELGVIMLKLEASSGKALIANGILI